MFISMKTLTPVRLTRKGKPFKFFIPNPAIFNQAFAMFITGKPLQEIMCELDVPYATLKSWIKRNHWVQQRNALINESAIDVQQQLKALLSANVLQVAERQLATAEKLDGHINEHLDKPSLGTKAIADLSRAAVSSAKIASDVVGLGKATEEASKKPCSIQFNLQVSVAPPQHHLPLPAAVPEEPVIDYF
jgi:hypothetical protein